MGGARLDLVLVYHTIGAKRARTSLAPPIFDLTPEFVDALVIFICKAYIIQVVALCSKLV
jgi:hypothetical protein